MGIRVTYSGLISFAVGLISVITGIIFTIIVTRSLSPEEFGTWNLIGGLIIYVIIIEPIISYWTTREIARGIESGKTAIMSSGIFSIVGVSAYLVIAYFLSGSIHANQNILVFSGILIPVMFLNRTLTAINLGWRPQSVSYGTIAFELTKIPAALVLVYFLHTGIHGAITSTVIAYISSIIILGFYSKEKIKVSFQQKYLKKWFKLSWLSIYPGIYNLIFHLDVIIYSVITGSVVGIAFYSASQAIANVVANSSLISQALYPKLLEGGKREHFQENLVRFFYFAFPLTALSLVFAKPALFALKPLYDIAVPVVIFMTFRTFFYVLGGLFTQVLLGIENVDINEQSKFKDFIKSKLFLVPTITLIQNISYVIVLAIGLVLIKPTTTSSIQFVIYWAAISLGTQIPFTIYFYFLVRRNFTTKIGTSIVSKYLLASVCSFGITYFIMEHFLNYKRSIFEFIPNLLLFAAIGVGIYLLITYTIDSRTRNLFQSIIREIRGI